MHPDSLDRDSQGYLKKHYYSCGPQALSKALSELDDYRSTSDISRDIQDNGNGLRLTLSLLHYEAISITFPSEVIDFFEELGYEVIEVDSLDKLDPNEDVAMVLIWWGEPIKYNAHWLCFPADKNIEKYSGEETVISRIFLIKKKNGG
jgi:hypothetical protein